MTFDKCTHISKYFHPLLAAFRQIDIRTFLLFCLVFWPPKGLCCVLQPLFEACCKQASQSAELLKTSSFPAGPAREGAVLCARVAVHGCTEPGGAVQCVCVHPARQKIPLTPAAQQTSQSYFWNSTRGEERDKVMKILSRWINVAALTFVNCSGDGLGDPPGMWVFVEEGEYMVILYFFFPVRKRLIFTFFRTCFWVCSESVEWQCLGAGARMREVMFWAGLGRAWQAGSHTNCWSVCIF